MGPEGVGAGGSMMLVSVDWVGDKTPSSKFGWAARWR